MRLIRQCALVISFAMVSPAVVHAAISATRGIVDTGASWAISLDGTSFFNTNQGGVFHWSSQTPNIPDFVNGVDGGGTHIGGGTDFISFCIELTQTIGAGLKTGISVINAEDAPQPGSAGPGPLPDSPMGAVAATYLADLWAQYLDDALLNSTNRAAFQLAVWKLAYDETLNLDLSPSSTGRIKSVAANSAGTVGALAQSWLDSLDGLGPLADLRALTQYVVADDPLSGSTNFQDQLVEIAPMAIPEPGMLAIWGLGGAIGLVLAKRRRR